MTTMSTDPKKIYISDLAEIVNRKPTTIRHWERMGLLPKHLLSERGMRGWRYWSPEQVEGIKQWMKDEDMRPGKGLPHYKPNEEELKRHLEGQRKPRGPRTDRVTS